MAEKNPNAPPGQASIVSVIREMVKAGENEENIIKSLKELGVKEKDAKKLLLLGEADTFALLQGEINNMVKEYFEKEKPGLEKFVKDKLGEEEQALVEKVEKRALSAFKEDQHFIENQATMFQARVNQSVNNILQLNDETKRKTMELNARLSNDERDLWAMKERVLGSKMLKMASNLIIALEIGLVAATGIMIVTSFQGAPITALITAAAIGAILAAIALLIRLRY